MGLKQATMACNVTASFTHKIGTQWGPYSEIGTFSLYPHPLQLHWTKGTARTRELKGGKERWWDLGETRRKEREKGGQLGDGNWRRKLGELMTPISTKLLHPRWSSSKIGQLFHLLLSRPLFPTGLEKHPPMLALVLTCKLPTRAQNNYYFHPSNVFPCHLSIFPPSGDLLLESSTPTSPQIPWSLDSKSTLPKPGLLLLQRTSLKLQPALESQKCVTG